MRANGCVLCVRAKGTSINLQINNDVVFTCEWREKRSARHGRINIKRDAAGIVPTFSIKNVRGNQLKYIIDAIEYAGFREGWAVRGRD